MEIKVHPEIRTFNVADLNPAEYNPRQIDDESLSGLAKSLEKFGLVEPIIVNVRNNKNIIVGGHQRFKVIQQSGVAQISCVVVDLSVEDEKLLNLALNNPATQGTFIDSISEYIATLKDQIPNEQDILDLRLDELMGQIEATEGLTGDDDIPPPPEEPVTKPGDIWLLGKHRLMCGDSTNPADVAILMNGQLADLVFSDPPYNVAYQGGTEDKLTIQNDAMPADKYITFMDAFFARFREAVKTDASLYICHASQWQLETELALRKAGFEVRNPIIWAKNCGAFGFARYKFQHEPIFYCHVAGESDNWYGDLTQTTVWHEKKPNANRLHPTMKPVEIVQRALVNSSKPGDLVLDLFLGSGTTLIAAQSLDRRCFGMEIDPRYADVIVRRFEEYTGQKAILESAA